VQLCMPTGPLDTPLDRLSRVPDAIFDDERLANIYDVLDSDRSDLDPYLALVDEFHADAVLDVGCGTGAYACLLAARGIEVVAVDPAEASLAVGRRKPGAERVEWVKGDATNLGQLKVDLVTMTGNVAQVFVADADWENTLKGVHDALRPGGHFVFETRDPERQAWRAWTPERSHRRTHIADIGVVESWVELTEEHGDLVSFRWTFVFLSDGTIISSDSTLRFRRREAITRSLTRAGFDVDEVREAPDRPGQEFVFVARRAD